MPGVVAKEGSKTASYSSCESSEESRANCPSASVPTLAERGSAMPDCHVDGSYIDSEQPGSSHLSLSA